MVRSQIVESRDHVSDLLSCSDGEVVQLLFVGCAHSAGIAARAACRSCCCRYADDVVCHVDGASSLVSSHISAVEFCFVFCAHGTGCCCGRSSDADHVVRHIDCTRAGVGRHVCIIEFCLIGRAHEAVAGLSRYSVSAGKDVEFINLAEIAFDKQSRCDAGSRQCPARLQQRRLRLADRIVYFRFCISIRDAVSCDRCRGVGFAIDLCSESARKIPFCYFIESSKDTEVCSVCLAFDFCSKGSGQVRFCNFILSCQIAEVGSYCVSLVLYLVKDGICDLL